MPPAHYIMSLFSTASTGGISIAFISFVYAVYRNLYKKCQRYSKISKLGERVLVLGASSGIGRSIARQYAERGARVCVVGRRDGLLNEVVAECRKSQTKEQKEEDSRIFGIAADFANVDDMVRTRTVIEASKVHKSSSTRIFFIISQFFFFFVEWKGLDTLVVAAGVSAVQPLMMIPGVATGVDKQATKEGIQRVVDVAAAATQGNYVGPLISAVTFVSFHPTYS